MGLKWSKCQSLLRLLVGVKLCSAGNLTEVMYVNFARLHSEVCKVKINVIHRNY